MLGYFFRHWFLISCLYGIARAKLFAGGLVNYYALLFSCTFASSTIDIIMLYRSVEFCRKKNCQMLTIDRWTHLTTSFSEKLLITCVVGHRLLKIAMGFPSLIDFVDRIYFVICRSEMIKGAVTVESGSNRWASITSSSTAQYLAAAVDSEAPMSACMGLNYGPIWTQTSTPKGPAW